MMVACTQPRQDEKALEIIDTRYLPAPDLTLDIKGLGPCTDQADRTIHLSSNDPVVVLVHGCFASSGRFRSLAEVFVFQGQQAICYNYDDRDSLKSVGRDLRRALDRLAEALNQQTIILIGHSQGGLISRYALKQAEFPAPSLTTSEQHLITISAPFSGISAADHCASTTARVISLGLVIPICMAISGDKWYEITHASDFMRYPGALNPGVNEHLLITTDERESCRRWKDNSCQEDDFVFSLEEQTLPGNAADPAIDQLTVQAGHAEIVGDSHTIPSKLIDVLQDKGILLETQANQLPRFEQRLSELFIEQTNPATP